MKEDTKNVLLKVKKRREVLIGKILN